MLYCKSCSAPLTESTGICNYCGCLNDIDLKEMYTPAHQQPQTDRICPECEKNLTTIALQINKPLYIQRCETCLGLFFTIQELQKLLDTAVAPVYTVDVKKIESLNIMANRNQTAIYYRKCPECRTLMHRINFGTRSGVIIDQCKEHGVWLDSGELKLLIEWKKAGGFILHEKHLATKNEELKQKQQRTSDLHRKYTAHTLSNSSLNTSPFNTQENDLIHVVSSLLMNLFS